MNESTDTNAPEATRGKVAKKAKKNSVRSEEPANAPALTAETSSFDATSSQDAIEDDTGFDAFVEISIQQIEDIDRKYLPNEARAQYDLGVVVRKVKKTPYKVRNAKEALGIILPRVRRKKSTGYRASTVAETWTETEFDSALKKTNRNGMPPSFSHFVELAKVEDKESRQSLFDEALNENLSVEELRKRIPTKSRKAGGGNRQPRFSSGKVAKAVETMEEGAQKQIDSWTAGLDGLKKMQKEEIWELTSAAEGLLRIAQNYRDAATTFGEHVERFMGTDRSDAEAECDGTSDDDPDGASDEDAENTSDEDPGDQADSEDEE